MLREQEKVWRMLTKRSRATFFRLKKTLTEAVETNAQANEAVSNFGLAVSADVA